MRFFLFSLLLIGSTSATADITINSITGYSNIQNFPVALNPNIIILGGFAGDPEDSNGNACSSLDGFSTCNNCGISFTACNEKRAYDELQLRIQFTSSTIYGVPRIATQKGLAQLSNISPDYISVNNTTAAGQQVTLGVRWKTICNNFSISAENPTPECVDIEGSTQTFTIGIDGSTTGASNGTLGDGDDDTITFTIVVATGGVGYGSAIDVNNCSQGLCNFSLFPGDGKAFIENVSLKAPKRPIHYIRFLCQEDGFSFIVASDVCARVAVLNNSLLKDSIEGLPNGVTQYFYAAVEDDAGNVGLYFKSDNANCPEGSTTNCRQVTPDQVFGLFNKEQNCFIATAAYGSPIEPHVQTLRRFRALVLQPTVLGRLFIRAYYTFSPPLAQWISQDSQRRTIVRWGLTPIVLGTSFAMNYPWVLALTLLGAFGLALLRLKFLDGEKRKQRNQL
jgi:hypothetical protein